MKNELEVWLKQLEIDIAEYCEMGRDFPLHGFGSLQDRLDHLRSIIARMPA